MLVESGLTAWAEEMNPDLLFLQAQLHHACPRTRTKSSDHDPMQQLWYEHPLHPEALLLLWRRERDWCTRYWSWDNSKEQLDRLDARSIRPHSENRTCGQISSFRSNFNLLSRHEMQHHCLIPSATGVDVISKTYFLSASLKWSKTDSNTSSRADHRIFQNE